MSQVKNLRAMFENKGDEPAPPDRGRSPASFGSKRGSNASESPRPLSTVRTSFVAIEKHGRIGLRRDHSFETSPSGTGASREADHESLTSGPPDDVRQTGRKPFAQEAILESPQANSMDTSIAIPSSKDMKTRPQENTTVIRTTTSASPQANPSPVNLAKGGATNYRRGEFAGEILLTSGDARSPLVPQALAEQIQSKWTSDNVEKDSQPASSSSIKTPSRAGRPAPATGSPALPNQGRTHSRASVTAVNHGSKPGSSGPQKLACVRTSKISETGFIKPKPKSPTKPVSLPSSLLAPTASSVSKGKAAAGKQASGHGSAAHSARPSGRVSVTGPVPSRTIRKQPSSINGSRPSLGPPPKQTSSKAVSTMHKERQVDEGFLARMMRPTQSSSSKTNEKAPSTPPRRSAQRQAQSGTSNNPRAMNGNKKTVGGAVATRPGALPSPKPAEPASRVRSSDASDAEVLLQRSELADSMKGVDDSQTDPMKQVLASADLSDSEQQDPILDRDERSIPSTAQESCTVTQEGSREVPGAISQPISPHIVDSVRVEQALHGASDDAAVAELLDSSVPPTGIPQQQQDDPRSQDSKDTVRSPAEPESSCLHFAICAQSPADESVSDSENSSALATASAKMKTSNTEDRA